MAYTSKTKENTQHPFRTVVKLAEAGIYPGAMLLFGREIFLVNWAEKYLRDKIINPASAVLDYSLFQEDASASDIIAACETLPLMSAKKLVVVRNTDIFLQQPRDMKAEDINDIAEYIPGIPSHCLLIFTCEKVNKTKALYKAIAKSGIVYDFTALDRDTLSGWIAKQLAMRGKTASRSCIGEYMDRCGYCRKDSQLSLYNIKGDLEKVCAYAENRALDMEDFKACMGRDEEEDVFALLDAAFSRDKGRALTLLHSSVDKEQLSKQSGVVLRFLGLLCSQLEIMVEAAERSAEGGDEYSMASAMGVNPYRVKKAMQSSAGRSPGQLKDSLRRAYNIEREFKSGAMDAYLALELFIAGL